MHGRTVSAVKVNNRLLPGQQGSTLFYLITVLLIAGTLGAAVVALTTTSTLIELQYNNSSQTRHLAQSGLDYAKSALEAEDPALQNEFRSGNIDETAFDLDNGRFVLTVTPDSSQTNLYHIVSVGRLNEGTSGETGFIITDEYTVSGGGGNVSVIEFSNHNIEVGLFPIGGIIERDTPETPGYTYDGDELVLYDDEGNELVTITTNASLRFSNLFGSGTLGTDYVWGEGGVITQGDFLEFTFPDDQTYTELTIHFSSFDPQDEAEVQLATAANPDIETYTITSSDLTDSSATITSPQPFDRFTITNSAAGWGNRRFGITGIEAR